MLKLPGEEAGDHQPISSTIALPFPEAGEGGERKDHGHCWRMHSGCSPPSLCFPLAAIPCTGQPTSQAHCDLLLQVFPALTSVLLQYTQPRHAWEGWSQSRSLPCLAGPSPLQIKNVYLK